MVFDILTIFPEIFRSPLSESLIKKALDKGVLQVRIWNLRDFTEDKHRTTDDYPYGGGAGMVMKADPIFRAVEEIKANNPDARTLLLTPQGERFHQGLAKGLSEQKHWILICGRYEGLDERVRLGVVDREISIGDYVLNGGEIPALVFLEVISRYVPGFLGSEQSVEEETFSDGLLEYPQYTRPPVIRGMEVPEILLSGNHAEIKRWRRRESLKRTYLRRPDLLERADLSEEDLEYLAELKSQKARE
ncbi:MAG TPA: tRNA (guanosine(37)-N1)-methyltransferase TrmD [Thermodesulfobacteriota bacterium]|nr:tRNA (guanosine(37)-N1)-methyltransferase TrmD [Thermodesulfobacteriota bacterium]